MAGGSTTDEGDPGNDVGDIIATLQLLVSKTNELNQKVDLLLNENQNLNHEIASLKECKPSTAPTSVNSKLSYAAAIGTKNDSKVLVVKQRRKATKSGDVIIKCGNEKELTSIQSQIQNNMVDNYSVEVPKLLEHRIKVVGINESEYNLSDNEILAKIKSQNKIPESRNRKIQIVRKTKIVSKKFNMILEVDATTYGVFIEKEKMNIGWNRCPVFNEYGIRRCFKCCRYGHLLKEYKENKVCAKCGGPHDVKECNEIEVIFITTEDGENSTNDYEEAESSNKQSQVHSETQENAPFFIEEKERLQKETFKEPFKGKHSKKRPLDIVEQRMDEAYKIIKNVSNAKKSKPNQCLLFGQLVAEKLEGFDEFTRLTIMRDIDNILFRAKINQLRQQSHYMISPPQSSPLSYTSQSTSPTT
ncbi:uncharacterized protein LOC126749761 [Anthonomus grandis grandis]|uniref:uncharacterized protein LOC126749761 n=1 Tax=Anthonomus grandis grandis TaxID=2921223 RepID=UPI00216639AD|nr:uncharacterized protein LOC126749761 [Anthonomus grandis grandis]